MSVNLLIGRVLRSSHIASRNVLKSTNMTSNITKIITAILKKKKFYLTPIILCAQNISFDDATYALIRFKYSV